MMTSTNKDDTESVKSEHEHPPLEESFDDLKMPHAAAPSTWPKSGWGEKTRFKCQDSVFAIFCVAIVFAVIACAIIYGPDAMNTPESSFQYDVYMYLASIIISISVVGSGIAMLLVIFYPQNFVKGSVFLLIGTSLICAIVGFASKQYILGVLGLIFLFMSIRYTQKIWPQMHTAIARLVPACIMIRANLVVTLYAWVIAAIAGLWSVTWMYAFVGIFNRGYACDGEMNCTQPNFGYLIMLIICYKYITQVMQNLVYVVVAGTIGHWWFNPADEKKFCSHTANMSFLRGITTAFGSVCFGSIVIPIAGGLRMLPGPPPRDDDDDNKDQEKKRGFCRLLVNDCCACKASFMEHLNKWSFVYVGVYGHSFLKGGQCTTELFKDRGWEEIATDGLMANMLFLVSIVAGAFIGALGLVISETTDIVAGAGGDYKKLGFLISFLIGMLITSLFMTTVGGAINTIIILYADAPGELRQNHPPLYELMLDTWSVAYPETKKTPPPHKEDP